MPDLSQDVTALVTTICEAFFDSTPAVLPGAAGASSPLWARVLILGAEAGEVWVSPSAGLAGRILLCGFGSGASDPAELEEATVELCNIVAGNLKALLPGPSQLGLPTFHSHGPERAGAEQRFDLTVDGEPLVVLFRRTA
jgi:hypothetical protein